MYHKGGYVTFFGRAGDSENCDFSAHSTRTEITAAIRVFRRMYRLVPMISAEEISLPKDRRCLRFKCDSFYELNAVNTLPVHDLSAVNDCILRFKYSSTDSLRTDNLDVRHPITAEVILNMFDKRLLVPSQPLGIVA